MADRGYSFLPAHEAKSCLKITEGHLTTNLVTTVACTLCSHVGRADVIGGKIEELRMESYSYFPLGEATTRTI